MDKEREYTAYKEVKAEEETFNGICLLKSSVMLQCGPFIKYILGFIGQGGQGRAS